MSFIIFFLLFNVSLFLHERRKCERENKKTKEERKREKAGVLYTYAGR